VVRQAHQPQGTASTSSAQGSGHRQAQATALTEPELFIPFKERFSVLCLPQRLSSLAQKL